MTTLSNTSDYDETNDDIVAEYENQESDGHQGNVEKYSDSENEESKEEKNTRRRIDPATSSKKHIIRNPLPKLNTERLKGPKGIHTIEKYFEGFKFHGQGYEKLDLDRIMKRLEHWGHRLFPKLDFDDFLEKLEKLGTKKDLQVFIKKYRLDMINEDTDIINQDKIDTEENKEQDEPIDEFDLLIAEQIEKQKQVIHQSSLNISTTNNDAFDKLSESNTINSQSMTNTIPSSQLSDEAKERIERNRQQAIQRRLARLKEVKEQAKRKKFEEIENAQAENKKALYLEDEEIESNSKEMNKSHNF
ncbi:PREDICTED: protein TIPIN homolog [Eufriesea mexicana]|uniref:protein TIPIN homolog n=1 Tax=Eufriesea mexicana TaxID=516756 RepID=UPI00083BB233|nr:PREDICTED: protein TIPIN homolog [Eufriesea mexicana]